MNDFKYTYALLQLLVLTSHMHKASRTQLLYPWVTCTKPEVYNYFIRPARASFLSCLWHAESTSSIHVMDIRASIAHSKKKCCRCRNNPTFPRLDVEVLNISGQAAHDHQVCLDSTLCVGRWGMQKKREKREKWSTSTFAPASSKVSLAAPSADDSPISMYPTVVDVQDTSTRINRYWSTRESEQRWILVSVETILVWDPTRESPGRKEFLSSTPNLTAVVSLSLYSRAKHSRNQIENGSNVNEVPPVLHYETAFLMLLDIWSQKAKISRQHNYRICKRL